MNATHSSSAGAAGAVMLEVSGIHAFYGQAHILFDVSLTICAGEVVVLLGRNGAGKSTTLKSIAGLVRPREGTVKFMGETIERRQPFEVARRGLGYVPEERRIFTELTVLENLEVGRQPPRPGVPAWDFEKIGKLFPNLAEMPDRPGGRMSGGEQQMLTIARTLMGNPLCILLDEPSEGVAPVIVDQMAAAITELKRQGVAVLLSEQNLHFAQEVGDRAYIIEKGRIRFEGSMAALRANDEVRAQYLAV
ncbi:MAG: ABC transporter ATP-binding protein [Betaproteobacteria bacterium]|nr:ABC transporter ATP-binding protein [Betaproteobacteria bacterium]